MFTGGSLQTTVAIRSGAAVNTAFFIMIVHVQSVDTVRATGTIGSLAAVGTCRSQNTPPIILRKVPEQVFYFSNTTCKKMQLKKFFKTFLIKNIFKAFPKILLME